MGVNKTKGARSGQDGTEARHVRAVGFERGSVKRVVEGNFNKQLSQQNATCSKSAFCFCDTRVEREACVWEEESRHPLSVSQRYDRRGPVCLSVGPELEGEA
jgi:hypothetical protein